MRIEQESHAEFKTGHGSVGGTAARLYNDNAKLAKGVRIKADLTNGNNIYVGSSEHVAVDAGFELDAGEFVEIAVDTLDKVWVIGGAADQGYSWVAI
jgi:hypothetical protein